MKIFLGAICFLMLVVETAVGQPAWYAVPASMTLSSQYGVSPISMTYRGTADIIFNSNTGSMEFEFNGNSVVTTTTIWAKSINVYCACESTVVISGVRNAVMPCQVWDENKQEVGQGSLKFRGLYNSTYNRWSVTGTYFGNGTGLVKGKNTLDQSSISLSLIK